MIDTPADAPATAVTRAPVAPARPPVTVRRLTAVRVTTLPVTTLPVTTLPVATLPVAALLGLALLAGLVSGAATSFGQGLLPGPFNGLANSVAPWLVVPFAAGAVVGAAGRRRGWAAAVGVLACLAQVAGYYLTADLRGFGINPAGVLLWVVTALPGGLVAGLAGRSWWRSGDPAARPARGERGLGAAVLVAAWLAQAVVTYGVVLGYVGDAVVSGVVGVLTFVLLGRRGRQHVRIALWLGPLLLLGAAGFAALHSL